MEDVEGCTAHMAGGDGVGECLFDDELAAAQLMMRMPFFMILIEVALMRPSVWVVRPDVEGEVVRGFEISSMGTRGDVVFARDDGSDEGVVADEVHAEAGGAAGDFEADATKADDAEGLAAELLALKGFSCPTCRACMVELRGGWSGRARS